ncbi:MAG: AMP-binding protein [Kiritimatiellae bacterium]|nr:AMP-binding protein [Kiritimatiellia bacterium]
MSCPWVNRVDFKSHEDFLQNCRLVYPEDFNFAFDVIDRIAAEDPNRRAMVWCNDHGEEHIFTMAEVARYSRKAANAFLSLGIRKGDPVMLILKRRYEYWFALLGLCRIGAIAIPATNQLMKKDVVYRVKAASVKMVLAVDDGDLLNVIEAAGQEVEIPIKGVVANVDRPGWVNFNQLAAAQPETVDEQFCLRHPAADDIMLLYFTSGTSGMPKMVCHGYKYPLGHVVTAVYWHCCSLGGLHLTVAETGWGKAAWGKIYGQWMAGSALMIYDMDRFHADNLLRVVEKYRVTTFCAPPTIYRFLIKEDLSKYDFSSITHCTTAGEALNPEVFKQFYEATGHKIYEAYGQTEEVVICGTFPWMQIKPGSMGRASFGHQVELINEDGKPCEIGEEGEVAIRVTDGKPLGQFICYYRDPRATANVFRDGYYFTGDIAWQDEDGYFWYVGRADDVIKSSGYRIGPFEVESALMEHPAVLECAITAAPDPVRGQVVKATIVLAKGYTGSDALVKELQDHVKHATAPYKYPRIVEFVPELPKTISGKIRHAAIRKRDAEQK